MKLIYFQKSCQFFHLFTYKEQEKEMLYTDSNITEIIIVH